LEQRRQDSLGDSLAFEIKHIIRAQIERFAGVFDISHNGIVSHLSIGKFEDIPQFGRQIGWRLRLARGVPMAANRSEGDAGQCNDNARPMVL
jgi:hypothetical protein